MNYDPKTLIAEAEEAEKTRDVFLSSMEAMVERAHGSAYRSDKPSVYNPDNHEHDFLTHTLPKVAYANPRVNARGRAGEVSRMIAKAMKHGLQRWVEDQKLNDTIQAVTQDAFFTFGCFLTIFEPAPWAAPYIKANDYEVVHLPVVRRLSPYQFILDPLCSDWRFARWLGHDILYDIDELKELALNPESGWNAEVVENLRATEDDIPWRDESIQRSSEFERNEAVIREIWCPEYHMPGYGPHDSPPEIAGKYHGTIFTIAKGQSGDDSEQWVRAPRPYFGPPWGPYTLLGMYRVMDLPFPLGPLCVQKPQADAVNDIGRVLDQGAKDYKRYTLTDGAELARTTKQAKNGHTYLVKGFSKDQITPIEEGGITEQQIAMYQFRRSRLDRVSSMSETQRGNAAASKTATAESIADQANETVVGHFKQRAYGAVTAVIDTAGWYAYNSDKFQVTLGEDAAAELGMQNPVFYGDPQGLYGAALGLDGPLQIGDYKDVVEITVENNSMDMVTSAMQKAQGLEMLGTVLPILDQAMQKPWMPLKEIGAYLADLYNNDNIYTWFDHVLQAQQQMQQMQMMMGMPPSPMGGPPQPELQMGGGVARPGMPVQPQKSGGAGHAYGPQAGMRGGMSAQYAMQRRPMEGKVSGGYQNPMQRGAA